MANTELTRNEETAVEREHTLVAPPVDITESTDQFLLTADLPGVDPKALHVEVRDGTLNLEGTWEAGEIAYRRDFSVPTGIDTAKVTARAVDGVVTITLPKAEAFKPRQIPIQS